MGNDVESRAQRLLEREDLAAERHAEHERAEVQESRLADARRRIKKHDAEVAAEQARRDAGQEADEIAAERYGIEERLERWAREGTDLLAELEDADARQRDALRRAGRDVGHDHGLLRLIPRWFRHRFGGFNSLTGISGSHPSGRDRTLAERDPLASRGTDPDAA